MGQVQVECTNVPRKMCARGRIWAAHMATASAAEGERAGRAPRGRRGAARARAAAGGGAAGGSGVELERSAAGDARRIPALGSRPGRGGTCAQTPGVPGPRATGWTAVQAAVEGGARLYPCKSEERIHRLEPPVIHLWVSGAWHGLGVE